MSGSGKDIADDFNSTAKRYLTRDISSSLLLAKYGLMLKFQAQSVDESALLVDSLCNTALQCLADRAAPGYPGYLGSSDMESVAALLRTLESSESAPHLPARASAQLAETGMKFVQQAEDTRDINDRNKMTDYARLCLEHAEKFKAIVDHRNEEVSTSKAITPSRRIILKKEGDNHAP